jgi:molecular chaperone HscB
MMMDPFALLGLAPRFDVDPQVLERAYFEKSREVHPDKFAMAPASERVAALSRSRALNDAYQTLRKPVTRAEHLLERAGLTIGANERVDAGLLTEFLELREELGDARASGATDRVAALEQTMKRRRSELLDRLAPLFAAGDALDEIKRVLIVLRYVDRYLEECDAVLDPAE